MFHSHFVISSKKEAARHPAESLKPLWQIFETAVQETLAMTQRCAWYLKKKTRRFLLCLERIWDKREMGVFLLFLEWLWRVWPINTFSFPVTSSAKFFPRTINFTAPIVVSGEFFKGNKRCHTFCCVSHVQRLQLFSLENDWIQKPATKWLWGHSLRTFITTKSQDDGWTWWRCAVQSHCDLLLYTRTHTDTPSSFMCQPLHTGACIFCF